MAVGFYPLMIRMEGRQVLLVGGGKVALRKFRALLPTGAQITAAAPTFAGEEGDWQGASRLAQPFDPQMIQGMDLVVAATDNRLVNAQVAQACHERGILCCVCDSLEESDFIFPAVVTRGKLKIAVSTCGEDPALAKSIRKELEERYSSQEAQRVAQAGEERRRRLGRL